MVGRAEGEQLGVAPAFVGDGGDDLAQTVAHVGLEPVLHLHVHDLEHLDLLGVVVVVMDRNLVLLALGKDDVFDLVVHVGLHLDPAAVGGALEVAFAELRVGVDQLVHDAVNLVVVDVAVALGPHVEVVVLLWRRPAAPAIFHRFHRRGPA